MSGKECRQVLELWLHRDDSTPFLPDEDAFVHEHLARCAECRLDHYVAESMLFVQGKRALPPPLDDLSRRRAIDRILETNPARNGSRPSRADPPSMATGRLWARFAAGLAAMIGLGLIAVILLLPAEPTPHNSGTALPTPAHPPVLGQLVLSAGEVFLGGNRAGDRKISQGTTLDVQDGTAVAKLDSGIDLHVGQKSRVVFSAKRETAMRLYLRSGRVLAAVDPNRHGSPFVVDTPHGQILVSGTVFSVEVNGTQTTVHVSRGIVEVYDRKTRRQTVTAGQLVVVGRTKFETYEAETSLPEDDRLRIMRAVGAEDAAELEISSRPKGAILWVDDIELGRTPVSFRARSGTRELKLFMDGYEPEVEIVTASPGTAIRRTFELTRLIPKETARGSAITSKRGEKTALPGSAEDLLDLALAYRRTRRWKDALAAYRTLARRFPRTALGCSALVSMGQIQMEQLGQASQALGSFDAYLKNNKNGTLALEASLGRAEALRKMGVMAEEKEALRQFLEDFPRAIQTEQVRARLKMLE